MKLIRALVACPALALLIGVTTGQKLNAASACSNADFQGVYGFFASGVILVAPGFPASLIGPFGRVGRLVADGKGNIAVANTASYNGNIIPEAYTATYTVNTDCSVDVRPLTGLPIGPSGSLVNVPFEFVGALGNNGNSVAVVLCGLGPGVPCSPTPQPTGNVIRVLLTRQSTSVGSCGTQSLSGGYQLDMSGSVIAGSVPQPFARDGLLTFDGKGGLSGQTTASASGLAVTVEAITGTYSIDALCNVSISYSLAGNHTWTGMLTNQSSGANLIVTDTGSVITGTLLSVGTGNSGATSGGPGGGTGGGTGGTGTTTAVASPKNLVVTTNQVQLNGSASTSADGKPLTYSWTVAPGSPSAAISGANSATPLVQLASGYNTYNFVLTVTDDTGKTATDTATVIYQ